MSNRCPSASPRSEPPSLTLTAPAAREVAAGTSARAQAATDLSELLAHATHGTATTSIVDGNGVPVGVPGTNVAVNRPTTASGQEVAGRWGPGEAVDGNLDTCYSSNASDSAWIAVELDEPTFVHHVSIAWELAAARYKLQVSDDRSTWTDATDELTATPNTVSVVELNTAGAVGFVRMQTIDRTPAQNGQKYGVSLKEFEVWDGPADGITFEDVVFDGTGLEWAGSLPASHSLLIEFTSPLKNDATPGTSYTVTSEVGRRTS